MNVKQSEIKRKIDYDAKVLLSRKNANVECKLDSLGRWSSRAFLLLFFLFFFFFFFEG